jgi:nitrogen fixation protein NifU and related proteins
MYSRTVLEHFTSPRNVGVIEDADGFARLKSSLHDDLIDLYIKVEDGHIADIAFRTFGCVAAIASSSMTTELAKGMSLEEAEQITEDQVVEALDGLPENKIKCSVLAPEALRQAVAEYREKHPEEK